ncbi:Transmembrane protein [Halotydeus destructor]|nr:Transmembrane protein [Halotydeus destructor]
MSDPTSVDRFCSELNFECARSVHSFIASLSVIIVSEIGDKTFFIAAIMAMRNPRCTVFSGAIIALIVMTLLSVTMGMATTIIPKTLTHYISIILFLVFGVKMLREGQTMTEEESKEEYEEVNKKLSQRDSNDIEYRAGSLTSEDPETGVIQPLKTVPWSTKIKRRLMTCFSLVFLETFTMTFVAEWGDRSQIATIILAAREDPFGVTLGAVLGHSLCSGIAVIGGRMVAQMISVRTVTIIGGVTFILFAISALIIGE